MEVGMTFNVGDRALYDGKEVKVEDVNNFPSPQLVKISGHGDKGRADDGRQHYPNGELVFWVSAGDLQPVR
jgi:hypothetical protein